MATRTYNPEGSRLRTDQLKMVDALLEFDRICKENDIQYWLDSGTLLGAARHGGFIPWDDDMDVCVMKKDYRKLRKILCKYRNEKYVYQCKENDIEHVNIFGKFIDRTTEVMTRDPRSAYFRNRGVGIDVFPIEFTTQFAAHAAKFFYLNLQHPTMYIRNRTLRHIAIKTVEILCFYLLIPLCRVIGWFNPGKEYRYQLGSGFYKGKFLMDQIFPLGTIEFEGHSFPAPKDVDAYLTNLYGDWRTPPSEDKIKAGIHSAIYLQEIFS